MNELEKVVADLGGIEPKLKEANRLIKVILDNVEHMGPFWIDNVRSDIYEMLIRLGGLRPSWPVLTLRKYERRPGYEVFVSVGSTSDSPSAWNIELRSDIHNGRATKSYTPAKQQITKSRIRNR